MRSVVRKFVPLRVRKAVYRMRHARSESASTSFGPLLVEAISAGISHEPTVREMLHQARDLHKHWRLTDALETVDKLLLRAPSFVPALFVKSDILIDLGAHDEARDVTLGILERDPLNVQAINQLAAIGHRVVVSIDTVERELKRQPLTGPLYVKAVQYLNAWSFFSEAEAIALEALEVMGADTPQHITDALLIALAFANERTGDFPQAISFLRKVKGVGARKTAEEAIARCEMERGNPALGAAVIGHAIFWDGEPVPYNKTLLPILYALGDIENAHLSYRSRGSSQMIANTFKMPPPSTIAIKSGKYKRQDALIFTEGGPGDEIRIASLYGQIRQYFKQLRVTCDPRLETLLCRSFPDIEFIPVSRYRAQFRSKDANDRLNLPHKAFWTFSNDEAFRLAQDSGFVCASLDLLGEFRTNRADFRASPSRLRAIPPDPSVIPLASPEQRVGLAWRSLLRSNTRDVHYLDVADLAPLARVPNTEYWLLQSSITPEEWEVLKWILPDAKFLPDLDIKDDLDGLASIISAMDVVVSPGTNIVELAGMLDVPTILLSTSHATTWRRNSDGSDVWFERGKVMFANPVWNRAALMLDVTQELTNRAPQKKRKRA
jgi:tetratricopeptide (TPR) repeat protein